MTPMDDARHELTVFAVTDVEGMVAFYERAFGWERRADFPIYVELADSTGQGVAFYERVAFGENTGHVPALAPEGALTGAELYLRCEDLGASIERLVAAGARLLRERTVKNWGEEVAYYADPEGNVVAVAQRQA